ncbi:DUF1601 domain-containing protein [Endozoicomonas sp. GU-1]|uniref:DUF1601 domain-containing protein n=1 Tax=Endozoicomonas sp. GU-1 TaxID=3009078 RepID=UPI0022B5618F|nr:DUF1601 domain-containing protein [Endozoicomonas sp. GU-1]WBA79321.1 DUF1601 domain-containing protein [Endozoicomonas sp. GU-1]WBA86962.1 DUF1601 domain-containing protein [Endozoicomonas sp. GU-1]
MNRSSAGISGQYARTDNNYKRPDSHAASSRLGRYRHATVRQWDGTPRTDPGRNTFYRSADACPYQHLQRRSVNPAQDFNALIQPGIMDDLVSKSDHFGHRYDGRNHGLYTNSIKRYTLAAKRPLNRAEQSQLTGLLQNFTITPRWDWRSLTTTLYSLTSAGFFTPHKPMDERVKLTQAALLTTLLDAIIFKCSQKPLARDIDARGIANQLWAMAKLVDNGQQWTPGLKEAVAALLPHVNAQKDQFIPQHIANLLWALAKLVVNGQKRTPELNEAVVALLLRVNAQRDRFHAQGIANLLWAMAKLVDNGQEQTPEFKKVIATLLPRVNVQKDQFTAQGIANLLWAMVKLVDNGQEQTAELNEAVAALLPHVNAQKNQFIPQHIASLLWAMAKLVDNGQEQTPGLKESVAALLPHVQAQKDQFNAQGIANLLWAMAKLVDNGLEQTPQLKEAVAALLPHVKVQKDQFNAQDIANLLWAMAKLVNNEQERTPELKEAVAALLPHANAQKDQFIPQHTANLLWAMAKLVDNGQAQTPEFKEAVAALLPCVNTQKDQFNSRDIAILLWAMAKLVDNGQEQASSLKETVTALLSQVSAQEDQFNAQDIANLLWAMAKLGELVELNVVKSTSELLVYKISKHPQLSQHDISMSLWGVMVCCARLSTDANADKNYLLEKHMDDLFTRLENASPNNRDEQSIIAMAANWLGRACPIVPHYQTTISKSQTALRDQLQSCIPSLKIAAERSLNSLPPVDLLLPDHNIIIEVQGASHYVCGDFKTRNGSTLLKIALLQKSGFEVIEIPTKSLWNPDSIKRYIDHIKTRVDIPPQGHGSVSDKIGRADEANATADKGGQSSDHCNLTAEEHAEKQTGKPKKRKRKKSNKSLAKMI